MFNPNGPTLLFCLDPQGNFHRLDVTIKPLGARSDLLLMAAGDQGKVIKNVTKLGELPVHLYAARDPAVAVVLPCIRMRTYYMANGTGKALCMVPHFSPDNAVEFQNDWTPSPDCKLVFVYRTGTCYLLAVHVHPAGQHSIRCLPLPNLYDDCRICMGNWTPPGGTTLMGVLDSAITHFSTSMWNTDLNGTTKREMTSQFMRFSIDGKQLPPTADWLQFTQAVAQANYNWVTQAVF